MATEADKTNNGVLVTLFVVGSAAMLGGSAAIVGMARTEMRSQSEEQAAYADTETVRGLKESQRKQLRDSKLPIDRAEAQLIAEIRKNPYRASWATNAEAEPAASAVPATSSAAPDAAGSASAEDEAPAASVQVPDAPPAASAAAPEAPEPESPAPTEDAPENAPPHSSVTP